jgi:hypothetical protein
MKCGCTTRDLALQGCKCGAFKAEQRGEVTLDLKPKSHLVREHIEGEGFTGYVSPRAWEKAAEAINKVRLFDVVRLALSTQSPELRALFQLRTQYAPDQEKISKIDMSIKTHLMGMDTRSSAMLMAALWPTTNCPFCQVMPKKVDEPWCDACDEL